MKSIMKVIYNFQMSKELLDLNKKHWTYRRNIGQRYISSVKTLNLTVEYTFQLEAYI